VGSSSIHFSFEPFMWLHVYFGNQCYSIMGIDLDILSTLPNNLFCLIISKLPFREVVQCFVLSKQWRFLYKEIPNMDLSTYFMTEKYLHRRTPDPLSMKTLENIVSNILQSYLSDMTVIRLTNDVAGWSPTVANSISW